MGWASSAEICESKKIAKKVGSISFSVPFSKKSSQPSVKDNSKLIAIKPISFERIKVVANSRS